MRAAGRVVAAAIKAMRAAVRAGVTTAELDAIGSAVYAEHSARSAPKLVYGFPGINCISVNDAAVHGIPNDVPLEPGDNVKLDVTAELNGYIADAAVTVAVDPVDPQVEALGEAARHAFYQGLKHLRAGVSMREWGKTVDHEISKAGFHVLRDLCGHGVGKTIHEPPRNVFNYDEPRMRDHFTENTVVAVEPIISVGADYTVKDPDGWTLRSADGSMTAHYEHTVIITKNQPIILTAA
jgi:methionyl aminopeptidase